MTATSVPSKLGWGGSGLNDSLQTLMDGVAGDTSLGHVNISLVSGGMAGTTLSLSGLASDDVLIGAFVINGMGAATPSFTSVEIVPTTGISHIDDGAATPSVLAGVFQLNIDTTDALVYVLWSKAADKNVIPSS